MKAKENGNILGKVVALKDGLRGKCVCQLESGEYLLATGKGGQLSTGFFDNDILSVDS